MIKMNNMKYILGVATSNLGVAIATAWRRPCVEMRLTVKTDTILPPFLGEGLVLSRLPLVTVYLLFGAIRFVHRHDSVVDSVNHDHVSFF